MDIKLYNDDCLQVMSDLIMKDVGQVDAIICDPPYGIDLTPQREKSKFKNTKVINDDDLSWLNEFVDKSYSLTKNIFVAFCGWQKIDIFKRAIEKKFILKNILIWNKDWFGMGNNYRPNYEMILLACKTNFTIPSNNKGNILTYRRLAPEKMVHSCEKPIDLMSDLIEELTKKNDTILDPFMGSGSTGVSSVINNRNFIGIELDTNYFNIAKKRINEANMSIFDI